jgi:hypothetical protein
VLPAEVLAALQNGDAIGCLTECYSCMFGSHFDPPKWHTWADDDDIEYARNTGQPDPRGSRCGCECAHSSTEETSL